MFLFRDKIPPDWLPRILANIPAVLVDHAHLERKAATTALNLEKYRDLYPRVEELNAIAIEELQNISLIKESKGKIIKSTNLLINLSYSKNGKYNEILLDLKDSHAREIQTKLEINNPSYFQKYALGYKTQYGEIKTAVIYPLTPYLAPDEQLALV